MSLSVYSSISSVCTMFLVVGICLGKIYGEETNKHTQENNTSEIAVAAPSPTPAEVVAIPLGEPVLASFVPDGWTVTPAPDIENVEGPYTLPDGNSVVFNIEGYRLVPTKKPDGRPRGAYIVEPRDPRTGLPLDMALKLAAGALDAVASTLSNLTLDLAMVEEVVKDVAEGPELPMPVKKAEIPDEKAALIKDALKRSQVVVPESKNKQKTSSGRDKAQSRSRSSEL